MANTSTPNSLAPALLPSIHLVLSALRASVLLTATFLEYKSPGPGYYSIDCSSNKKATYVSSKYKSIPYGRFGGESRTDFWQIVDTPGPGMYQAPSEFGIYRAKDRFLREFEKTDRGRTSSLKAQSKKRKSRSIHSHKEDDVMAITVSVDLKG